MVISQHHIIYYIILLSITQSFLSVKSLFPEARPLWPFPGPAAHSGRRRQPHQQHLQRRGEALPRAAAGGVAGNGGVEEPWRWRVYMDLYGFIMIYIDYLYIYIYDITWIYMDLYGVVWNNGYSTDFYGGFHS